MGLRTHLTTTCGGGLPPSRTTAGVRFDRGPVPSQKKKEFIRVAGVENDGMRERRKGGQEGRGALVLVLRRLLRAASPNYAGARFFVCVCLGE